MDVLASQFTADVKLKSDTVNVDVNPGDLRFPLQASTPQIAHVHQYIPAVLGKRSAPDKSILRQTEEELRSRTLNNNL